MMRNLFGGVLALALVFASSTTLAQQPYVDIEQRLTPEQLRAVGLSPEQLQLLNRMLREAAQKEPATPMARASDEVNAATRGKGERQGPALYSGLDEGPIKSRVKGEVSGWEPGTVFVLENGQQWKVLKGSAKLRKTLQSPEILVVPGIAGRWFLQVEEDMPKARVYRID
jgi:hypothetical protein